MFDIDPNLRLKSSLKNGTEIKSGYDAFVLSLTDIIETSISENPEDPNRGTYIQEYLKENVNSFNAFVIEDIVKRVVRNYLNDYDVDVDAINVYVDRINNEYVVVVPVKESDESDNNRNLKIVLEVNR